MPDFIPAPSFVQDPLALRKQVWFGGQIDGGIIKDAIYLLSSVDQGGRSWPNRSQTREVLSSNNQELILAVREQVRLQIQAGEEPLNYECITKDEFCVTHVNDPAVNIVRNNSTGTYQYTMFFTMCPFPCRETPTYNQAEIWSMVSSDGISWHYPQLLLRGILKGPAEPAVIFDPESNGTLWKVYFISRLKSTEVQMVRVGGNRQPIGDEQTVFTWTKPNIITSIDVKKIGSRYVMLFNNFAKLITVDYYGKDYDFPQSIQLYAVESTSPTQWISGSEYKLVELNPYGGTCALLTPSLSESSKPGYYDASFSTVPTVYRPDGTPFCDLMHGIRTNSQQPLLRGTFRTSSL